MKNEEWNAKFVFILISSFDIRNSKFVFDSARRAYRKQVLQHRPRPPGPGLFGMIAAGVLLEVQVVIRPPFFEQPVAQRTRVAERLPPVPPTHVEPDARPRSIETIEKSEDRSLVPPDGG